MRYAPIPVIPPGTIVNAAGCRGIFAIDIGVVTGMPYAVRILKSTGSKAVDDVILSTLQQWRFRPRSTYKAIVPVDITATKTGRVR